VAEGLAAATASADDFRPVGRRSQASRLRKLAGVFLGRCSVETRGVEGTGSPLESHQNVSVECRAGVQADFRPNSVGFAQPIGEVAAVAQAHFTCIVTVISGNSKRVTSKSGGIPLLSNAIFRHRRRHDGWGLSSRSRQNVELVSLVTEESVRQEETGGG
jgi:hypothetical protein